MTLVVQWGLLNLFKFLSNELIGFSEVSRDETLHKYRKLDNKYTYIILINWVNTQKIVVYIIN